MAAGGDDGGGGAPAADTAAAPPFGDQLRRARRAAGLTQEELAERARLSARAVSDLERGVKRAPRPDTLRRLAGVLRLAPEARAALAAAAARTAVAPSGGGAAPPGPRHNLPAQLTSFVGRERELAELAALLGAQRLVTLTGPGGVGKTRLALQAAADAPDAYPDGVWLVELAALAEPALVPQAVAAAVGVREEPGRPVLATLTDALRGRRLLLVLDNCEHLLDACARLTDALLRVCPHLQILATSREALGIAGETAWRVPSLSLPAPRDAQHPRPPEALTQYEAVHLFVDRAVAVQPAFRVTTQNAPAVAQICQRLDGIPLAIELAAVRVRALTVGQVLTRLEDRFRLLTGGSRTALERQQTLRATVDWSHALLPAPEQALFRRLAVFAGGFTLEAAEPVGAGESPGEGIVADEVLDLLTHLVDKSLVGQETLPDGSGRYRLLETLRQYAQHKLAAGGEVAAARGRHAACYLAVAETAAPGLHGPEQGGWLDRLELEHDNLRAALRWLLDQEDVDGAVRLAWALLWFWEIRGHVTEGRRWLAEVLARPALPAHPALHAQALAAAGQLAYRHREIGDARRWLAASVAQFRALGDQAGEAAALRGLGVATFRDGDQATGRATLEASLSLCRAWGDRWETAETLNLLAIITRDQGDFTRSRTFFEESLALYRQVGDRLGEGSALLGLANMALALGDAAQAQAGATQALAIMRTLGHRQGTISSLASISMVALLRGRHDLARAHAEEVRTLARAYHVDWAIWLGHWLLGVGALAAGDQHAAHGHGEALLAHGEAQAAPGASSLGHWLLGVLALTANELDVARAHSRTALVRARDPGGPDNVATRFPLLALEVAAALAAAQGQADRALRLAAAATRLQDATGAPQDRGRHVRRLVLEQWLAPARGQLSAAAQAAAEAAGRAMTLEQALAYALDDVEEPARA